ncbi:hypothetical protein BB561_003918 [Smittium simulii]|uniref:Aminotransferase class I/classII large domain-containing protein n=1 Tax=Smittium simulii TaxID=133385 RepID=A0A2T9YIX9_9FUNG|nr:hypothetical protein BB561_003918 [Smittium simulii]
MDPLSFLSTIAQENLAFQDDNAEVFNKVNSNRYNKHSNPAGILNMGIAVNKLQEDIVVKKLNTINHITPENLEYGDPTGSSSLRSEIAHLTNRHFNVYRNVLPEQIVVANGVTSVIDMLISTVCNRGDAVLVSAPYYNAFDTDVNLRAKVVTHSVNIPISEGLDPSQVKYFQHTYNSLAAEGIKAKILIICNPHNPTGRIYPKETIRALLSFASKHKMHVLVDEIYALSVYRAPAFGDQPETKDDLIYDFESVLSWNDLDSYIDPSFVTVVHGMSKDFCMNGIRMGWIISPWNDLIIKALASISIFSYSSSVSDTLITRFLADHQFVDNFIKIVARNLKENYLKTTRFFNANNIAYIPAQAGHFIWSDFRQLLLQWKNNNLSPNEKSLSSAKQLTFKDDKEMWYNAVSDASVCYSCGVNFHSETPGWSRVVFSIPWEDLIVGLSRVISYSKTLNGKGKLLNLSKL